MCLRLGRTSKCYGCGVICGAHRLYGTFVRSHRHPRTFVCCRKACNSIASHPSARVALSVGRDLTLRLIDLMKGKVIATKSTPQEPREVRYTADGNAFAIMFDSSIVVYDTSTAEPSSTVLLPENTTKFATFEFVQAGGQERIAAGCEGGALLLAELDGTTVSQIATGHVGRVRCISASQRGLLFTVGADAVVLMWTTEDLIAAPATPLHRLQAAAGFRGTCLAITGDAAVPTLSKPAAENAGKRTAAKKQQVPEPAGSSTAVRAEPPVEGRTKKKAPKPDPASIKASGAASAPVTAVPAAAATSSAPQGKRKRVVAFALPS
jgi:hypothetical protein